MNSDRSTRLAAFTEWCRQHIRGDEKGEAQLFLDRLFQAFGRGGVKETGGEFELRVRNDRGGTSFADLVWKPVVLIEMKKRGEDLGRHLQQAFDYWVQLVPNRPRYVVLCNFDEFRIYDFDRDIYEAQDTVSLAELADRYGPLNFLFPTNEKPIFGVDREDVTRKAADTLANVYKSIRDRKVVPPSLAQRFVLQMLVALFSEDIGLLPKHFVTTILDECTDPTKAFDLLNSLFIAMNSDRGTKGGRFKDVPYFNGGIFAESAAIELTGAEVSLLRLAATSKWQHVSPDIFGTIFQHSMNAAVRHAYGAHYTSQLDIMKIVLPTISTPFRQAIDRADTLAELASIRNQLQSLQVLDPACGSGNFLYVAYRELRRIEAELNRKELERRKAMKGQTALGGVSPKQFFGLDVLPFAVELAKVTLSIAPKLASDELHTIEPTLPLYNLDANIRCVDALIDWPIDNKTPEGFDKTRSRSRTEWPPADVIIGNPPFLGAKKFKPERGKDYVRAVRNTYPEVPGMADFCVYWFHRAHDELPVCTTANPLRGRAGLVGTQNIRNNKSRVGGLDHIVKSGVIVEAVENQPWSGEADVHVSIANWVKTSESNGNPRPIHGIAVHRSGADDARYANTFGVGGKFDESSLYIPAPRRLWSKVDSKLALFDQDNSKLNPKVVTKGKRGRVRADKSYELALRECLAINSALSDQVDLSGARVLECCATPQRVFQGITPGHRGFVLSPAQRRSLLADDKSSKEVVFPYLVGRELLTGNGSPSRFLIDFEQREINEAQGFDAAFKHVQRSVLPSREASVAKDKAKEGGVVRSHHKQFLDRWWKLAWDRADMLAEFQKLHGRYLVCSRVTKRPVFVFVSKLVRPGDALQTFAFDDDYSFGILQANTHWRWFIAKCSKLTERYRYTPESVFDTFPWPQRPTKKQIRAVAETGREVRAIRRKVLSTSKGGLRALYRTLELPGRNPLKDAHEALDTAVIDAYGFSGRKDLLAQVLALNLEVAALNDGNKPVTAPGIPTSYGNAGDLITDDCIGP